MLKIKGKPRFLAPSAPRHLNFFLWLPGMVWWFLKVVPRTLLIKCGLGTRSISIPRQLVRGAESQAPTHSHGMKVCFFTRSPSNSRAYQNLKSSSLVSPLGKPHWLQPALTVVGTAQELLLGPFPPGSRMEPLPECDGLCKTKRKCFVPKL